MRNCSRLYSPTPRAAVMSNRFTSSFRVPLRELASQLASFCSTCPAQSQREQEAPCLRALVVPALPSLPDEPRYSAPFLLSCAKPKRNSHLVLVLLHHSFSSIRGIGFSFQREVQPSPSLGHESRRTTRSKTRVGSFSVLQARGGASASARRERRERGEGNGGEAGKRTLSRVADVLDGLLHRRDVVGLGVRDLLRTQATFVRTSHTHHPASLSLNNLAAGRKEGGGGGQEGKKGRGAGKRTMENSSSIAMTTSTASSESRPRSPVKEAVGETWWG